MPSVGGLFMMMVRSSFFAAILNIPSPITALSGLLWPRKPHHKVDLITQPCYTQIIPGLYLSNVRAARDRNVLRQLNITHILTVETYRLPKSVVANTNISTLFIRADDTPSTNLLPYFPMANAFIEDALERGNIIVHCQIGVSRSATLVIAYIMQKYRLTFEQAYSYVKQRRKFINPNHGFVRQLKEYESLNYNVRGYSRFEAFMNEHVRRHKYKIASAAAVIIGILIPIFVLVF